MDWKNPDEIERIRHNLCDIAWLLKGMKINAQEWPLSDQENSLKDVITMLSGLKVEAIKAKAS